LIRRPPGLLTTLLEINYLFLDNVRGFPPSSYCLTECDKDVPDENVAKKWYVSSRWKRQTSLLLSKNK
jgi:hypothetical protein